MKKIVGISVKIYNKRNYRKRRSLGKLSLRNGATLSSLKLKELNLKLKKHSKAVERISAHELRNHAIEVQLPAYIIRVPRVLCHIRDPIGTIEFLAKLEDNLRIENPRNILVDHHDVEEIGISASWHFDEIISSLKARIKARNQRFHLKGRTSCNRSVNNFLLAQGFLQKMNINMISIKDAVDLDYLSKYQSFEIRGNKAKSHLKGNASSGLTVYFDKCLGNSNLTLTTKGKGKLVAAFGEIIGNAEEHVDEIRDWIALGCFDKDSKYVNFAIINFGQSIYQTLSSSNSTASAVIEDIQGRIKEQRSRLQVLKDAIFNIDHWDETVWNVMAIQEGISSKRSEDLGAASSTRGQGLIDFLEFISEVAERSDDSAIVILSGHSHIHIDFNKYKLSKVVINGESWRRLSLNASGHLDDPQDKKYVYPLATPFEGTIITGRFKISPKYASSLDKSQEMRR